MGEQRELKGPDLRLGVPEGDIPVGGTLLGHAGDEPILLVREGDEILAIGATCTHYGGPLAEGIVAEGTVRCPWHHACFDLRTGEPVRPPALQPVGVWTVERRDGKAFVTEKRSVAVVRKPARQPASVVILGGGAVGAVAAATLRREGYTGPITIVSADGTTPYDRPNASKDYLAGKAPEEWMPLFPEEFYREAKIDLLLETRVSAIDVAGKRVLLSEGRHRPYEALLIATGADPIRLPLPGSDRPHVFTLRTLADSRRIIEAVGKGAKRAVVIGASFIGLEVAAALRERDVAVTVVAPEARPLERVVGPELGDFVRALHEEHGVVFRLGARPETIEDDVVRITGGERLPADLVVMGVGVRPATALAEAAGLTVDRGIVVDSKLQTSAPGVFAAGDVARYPDPVTGERIRVEHWVVAERQAQLAARNILGADEALDIVPFFWSQHYDVPIVYVGHAESWDETRVHGDVAGRDCRVELVEGGRVAAIATIYRDVESLSFELEMEREIRRLRGQSK
jgi:NADPH-dependent 2,4-dienoyl-CoA reductase/sulfur reductase-like enzyme/nitrite reductase/ring-hydroxylating ferredoxin subunit